MDILDIFLDILLKPPQPLIGLFLGPWDRLFLKLHRVFGYTGGERGMTGEDGRFGV